MSSIKTLLEKGGFPQFGLDDSGYPRPGEVIRFYRERMTYTNADGKEKYWTQGDLAKILRVSEVTVRLMETKDKGLDSITRRRALSDLLKIPPVLLGLASIADLENFFEHRGQSGNNYVPVHTNDDTVSLHRNALSLYWNSHYAGTASIDPLTQWAGKALQSLKDGDPRQKAERGEILCSYYQLISKVLADDCQYKEAFTYLDDAAELATELNNMELLAAIHYRYGYARLGQRKFTLAKTSLDAALNLVNYAPTSLQGAIYQTTGLAHALTAQTGSDVTKAQLLLDKAESLVPNTKEDQHHVKNHKGKYFIDRADSLLALKRPAKALEILDLAYESVGNDQKRRKAYIDILRAEAFMNLKKPNYEAASIQLVTAFDGSVDVKSQYNMNYIARLHGNLAASSYGNATDVVDLGLSLKRWQKDQAARLV